MYHKEMAYKIFISKLRDKFRSQSEASRYFGVSRAHMSRVYRGEKPPNDAMMLSVGLERNVVYVDVSPVDIKPKGE
jgi:hypothetical protein